MEIGARVRSTSRHIWVGDIWNPPHPGHKINGRLSVSMVKSKLMYQFYNESLLISEYEYRMPHSTYPYWAEMRDMRDLPTWGK
jgi:hypothetical protein